jgi:hypothetical protein
VLDWLDVLVSPFGMTTRSCCVDVMGLPSGAVVRLLAVALVPLLPLVKVWRLSVSTPLLSTLFWVFVAWTLSTTGAAGVVVVCVEVVVWEDRPWFWANALPVIIAATATLASQYFVIP